MTKIFSGRIIDIDTNIPITGVKIYPSGNPTGGVITDDLGEFDLAADDANLSQWYEIDAMSQGYGDAASQLAALNGDIFVYKTDSGIVSQAKAAVKNSGFGFIITVAAIVLILIISKKLLQWQ